MTVQHMLPTNWAKSSRSNSTQPDCVEIAQNDEFGRVRDSKNVDGGAITVSRDALAAFVNAVKTAE
ncbi:hypothetical protein GCM10009676_09440 [Prauserella halophila]|uniref:DUF397 domain-containing protein n=1 Tax=Prauserella halophila TaxID=185641 RepID=A0ABN1W0T4_9PSEU|nr:DUF397 domain-containing protein [Prauserella halophila]MCP2235300.1 protein of unknown function (DUF397) [Prauserella halophila]